MDETKVLSLAEKIKTPVPLAALAVLALTLVGLVVARVVPADQLGGKETQSLLTILLVGLLVIAFLTVVGVLAVYRPKAQVPESRTYGAASPLEVDGNYTATLKGLTVSPSDLGKVIADSGARNQTSGIASPVYVKGDFKVKIDNGTSRTKT